MDPLDQLEEETRNALATNDIARLQVLAIIELARTIKKHGAPIA